MPANPFSPNQPTLPPYSGQQPQPIDTLGSQPTPDQSNEQPVDQAQAVQKQPPHPDFSRGPAQPGEVRRAPVWVDQDQWVGMQTELQSLRRMKELQDENDRMREAEQARLKAEKGQIEEAFNQLRSMDEKRIKDATDRARAIEQNWLNERLRSVISSVLAGRQFVGKDPSKTAALVQRALEGEIEAVMGASGEPIVRDRVTLRPAADYLKERLDSPDSEFESLMAPKNRGGSGTDGTRTPAPPVSGPPSAPPTPDQAISMWQKSPGYSDSFGMTRRRSGA